jgi:hypothetical protein
MDLMGLGCSCFGAAFLFWSCVLALVASAMDPRRISTCTVVIPISDLALNIYLLL